jgi:hypothetical protein
VTRLRGFHQDIIDEREEANEQTAPGSHIGHLNTVACSRPEGLHHF